MEHISTLLNAKKKDLSWSNRKISHETYIDETVISKHLNGKREVSIGDLKKYCKCFGLDYEETKSKYNLEAVEICKKDTLKNILASISAVGIGSVVYVGVKKLIDKNCKKLS